jgi:hypothetical protein
LFAVANNKNVIPPKAPVLSLVERDGRVRSFHVHDVTAQTLKPIIVAHVNKATCLLHRSHFAFDR